jgi:hypothetical protein
MEKKEVYIRVENTRTKIGMEEWILEDGNYLGKLTVETEDGKFTKRRRRKYAFHLCIYFIYTTIKCIVTWWLKAEIETSAARQRLGKHITAEKKTMWRRCYDTVDRAAGD